MSFLAFGGFPGGDTPWVFLWFGLLMAGVCFIAMALKDDNRGREEKDESVRDLQEQRNLPLRPVREALRPPRQKKTPDPSKSGPSSSPRSRGYGARTGGPRGLVK